MRYATEEYEFPDRSKQHQSETLSAKIFNNILPKEWVIRSMSERDYGIDFYIELANCKGKLTGDLISIQLKGKEKIKWTQKDTFAMSDISVSSTNYWANYVVPVFIMLTDNESEELFYLSVKDYVRKNYNQFIAQSKLTYHFDKNQKLSNGIDIERFLDTYKRETERERFEVTIVTVLSSLESYKDFISYHTDLDFHLEVENEEVIKIEAILSNYNYLLNQFGVPSNLPTINELKANNINYYNNSFIELYEGDLTKISKELKETSITIVKLCQQLVETEKHYWEMTNKSLVDFLDEFEVDSLFDDTVF